MSVYTTTHEQVDVGPLHTSSDPLILAADPPPLDPGIYTVVWQSPVPGGPNHATAGAYAFDQRARRGPRQRRLPRLGVYTPIVGDWQVHVQLGTSASESATFPATVRTEPVVPPATRAPRIDSSTPAIGSIEVLLVIAGLFVASRLSRWLSMPATARALNAQCCATCRAPNGTAELELAR